MVKKLREQNKDVHRALLLRGRHQEIPHHVDRYFSRPIFAAGAVLWRDGLYAVIHRPYYDDWSLAKGKVDKGENLPQTALREIHEETGFRIHLGKLIGKVTYPIKTHTKVVYYWTAEVIGGEFTPNEEVDEIRWLPFEEARELLSYEVDRAVLEKAEKRRRVPTDSRIILVRHAHAGDPNDWDGPDEMRPLIEKGKKQAKMLAKELIGFAPTDIYTATVKRCVDTSRPLVKATGIGASTTKLLDDASWVENPKPTEEFLSELSKTPGVHVVFAQRGMITEITNWFSANGRLPLDDIHAKKGSAWILSFCEGELTGADYLASPLPVR
ncbi:MAG: NUDIX hydrolase [Corynebacterium sp.]|nr:NUDIX hydrolase [Corynebacterium sp.]